MQLYKAECNCIWMSSKGVQYSVSAIIAEKMSFHAEGIEKEKEEKYY